MKIYLKYCFLTIIIAACTTFLIAGCSSGNVNTPEKISKPDYASTDQTAVGSSKVVPTNSKPPLPSTTPTLTSKPGAKVTSIPVLYYHSVLIEPGNPLRMPPEQFNAQMKYLSGRGYHVITPDQLYSYLFANGKLPTKPIMITFDDGYADNYTNAYPILQRYHFAATVFMVSNFINGKGFLSSDQLRKLQSAGWTIGGHTANHTDLSKVNPEVIAKELQTSGKTLGEMLGRPPRYFAYPFGGYNSGAIDALKRYGYIMAFTTERGWAKNTQGAFLVRRVYCYANMGMQEFARRVNSPNY